MALFPRDPNFPRPKTPTKRPPNFPRPKGIPIPRVGIRNVFTVELEILNPEVLKKFDELGREFERELAKAFKELVFDVHKYLIRITPIDTGELRGGWTAFLDSQRISYSQQIFDTSVAIKARNRPYRPSAAAVQKGRANSRYEFPNPLNVTLINQVPHAFYLEHGTARIQGRNFTALARYKAELRFNSVLGEWFKQIADAGEIVPFKSRDEDITS